MICINYIYAIKKIIILIGFQYHMGEILSWVTCWYHERVSEALEWVSGVIKLILKLHQYYEIFIILSFLKKKEKKLYFGKTWNFFKTNFSIEIFIKKNRSFWNYGKQIESLKNSTGGNIRWYHTRTDHSEIPGQGQYRTIIIMINIKIYNSFFIFIS